MSVNPRRPDSLDDAEREDVPGAPGAGPIARVVWVVLGLLFVALGAVGAVLPGLPTTPFLLVAAACFARGSRRLYAKLLGSKTFGPMIRDFREGRGVSARVKTTALGTMWVFIAIGLGPGLPEGNVWLRVLVAAAAVTGTVYLLRIPTRRPDEESEPNGEAP